jgi:hypothetical protein
MTFALIEHGLFQSSTMDRKRRSYRIPAEKRGLIPFPRSSGTLSGFHLGPAAQTEKLDPSIFVRCCRVTSKDLRRLTTYRVAAKFQSLIASAA